LITGEEAAFYPSNKNTAGFLCRSGRDFFHSAIDFVFTHSFSEVSSAAIHNFVERMHVFRIVSSN
jgi:hypothetical protein